MVVSNQPQADTRVCKACQQTLPITDFSGYHRQCNPCLARLRRERYAAKRAAGFTLKPRSEWTDDDFREQTEDARRQSRFVAAEGRIKQIVDGMPALTDEQLSKLAILLRPQR